jgi:uncharacterized protein YndB with AHSA1/START domain
VIRPSSTGYRGAFIGAVLACRLNHCGERGSDDPSVSARTHDPERDYRDKRNEGLRRSPPRVSNLTLAYGPAHFDTPRERIHIDLRVGGRYELTMVQRDTRREFAIGYDIIELVEPELIVLRSDPMPQMGMHQPTITRVELHDHGAKTRMTLSDGPYPEGDGHAEAGWSAAFDKLATHVAG